MLSGKGSTCLVVFSVSTSVKFLEDHQIFRWCLLVAFGFRWMIWCPLIRGKKTSGVSFVSN